jgi:SAM-dependent methyltransferase
MVQTYNTRAAAAGLPPSQIHAIEGNVLDDASWSQIRANTALRDFDIAVIGMGFHHFAKPAQALERVAALLKPATGVMVVIDIIKEADEAEDAEQRKRGGLAAHTIHPAHNGFVEQEMKGIYADAGLEDFGWSVGEPVRMLGKEDYEFVKTVFFSRGVRKGV